jgi:hypothetical protein
MLLVRANLGSSAGIQRVNSAYGDGLESRATYVRQGSSPFMHKRAEHRVRASRYGSESIQSTVTHSAYIEIV